MCVCVCVCVCVCFVDDMAYMDIPIYLWHHSLDHESFKHVKIIWRQIFDATEDFQNKETRARFGGRETRTLCGSVDLVKENMQNTTFKDLLHEVDCMQVFTTIFAMTKEIRSQLIHVCLCL